MPDNCHVWISHCPNQSLCSLLFRHFKFGVNAGNHQVKRSQHLVTIVQASIGQNIAFDAFENAKIVQVGIQLINFVVLLLDTLFGEPVGIHRRLGMVADHQVFISSGAASFRHFRNGISAIAVMGMAVNNALHIPLRKQGGNAIFKCGLDFTKILPQLRWNVLHTQFSENIHFCFAGNILGFISEQPIFTHLETVFPGELPHGYVVLFRACEMMQGIRVLLVAHNPQIGINPIFQYYAGFGFSLAGYSLNLRQ